MAILCVAEAEAEGPAVMTPRPAGPWYVTLVVTLIVATLGITAAATLLSFLAFRSLAELVGWSQTTAWLVQPVVELFVLAGAAELAMRTWEKRTASLPEVLMYVALVVSIAVNVSSHVLANVDARALWWHTAVIGVLAAFVPLAQVGGVFLLTDRLRALGDRRTGGEMVREEVTNADGSGGRTPAPGSSAPDSDSDSDGDMGTLAGLAGSNGNGHAITLKAQAEREALKYLEKHGELPSEKALTGMGPWSRGTARNVLEPLKKG